MPAIGKALETAQRVRGYGNELRVTMENVRRQREQDRIAEEERQQREAQFLQGAIVNEWSDPRRWRDASPREVGDALARVNASRDVLGLPRIENLEDPRQNAVLADVYQMQTWAQKRIPWPVVQRYFEDKYGRIWLDENNVNWANQEVLQGAQQAMQEPVEDGKPAAKKAEQEQGPAATGTPGWLGEQAGSFQVLEGVNPRQPAMAPTTAERQFEPEDPEAAVPRSGEELPTSAAAGGAQPVMAPTARRWDQTLGEIYTQYETEPPTIADAMNIARVLESPVGVALVSATRDGLETMHTMGKMFGLTEDEWQNDRAGYVQKLQGTLRGLRDDERREKNAKILLALLPKLPGIIQDGADPAETAAAIYQIAAPLGFELGPDGSLSELAPFIASLDAIAPLDQAKLDQASRSLDIKATQTNIAKMNAESNRIRAQASGRGASKDKVPNLTTLMELDSSLRRAQSSLEVILASGKQYIGGKARPLDDATRKAYEKSLDEIVAQRTVAGALINSQLGGQSGGGININVGQQGWPGAPGPGGAGDGGFKKTWSTKQYEAEWKDALIGFGQKGTDETRVKNAIGTDLEAKGMKDKAMRVAEIDRLMGLYYYPNAPKKKGK